MNILEIIAKKRDKKVSSKEEIDFFVKNYTNGNITDYQAAALIMAIYINGMNYEETTSFTLAMAHSGEVLDLSELGMVVDKHSTGGIGDKITLILMPIIASLGIPSAKMSGRGLGFTGGTVDKLESIPGYNTNIDISEFINNVKNIGISLMGQTLNLAPADKKIYALRDTISCVESIPLIASSIMSKKIAAGAEKIVLEVTVGSGAFMKNIEDATKLSETMIGIGNLADKETICILTNMNQPIGYSIGNSLEVIEAVEALNGNMSVDPVTGYGVCKYTAGKLSRIFAQNMGLRHIWVRILSVYGPGDNKKTLISSCIDSILNNKPFDTTEGNQMWDYIYSEDCARAFIKVATSGVDGKVYTIGSGKIRPLREYIEIIRDNINPDFNVGFGRRAYNKNQVMYLKADISELVNDTGFVPQITFEEGIKRTIKWFRGNN